MKFSTLILAACGLMTTACGSQKKMSMQETQAIIETSMGNITVKLYNETPKHRDNFIRLAKEGVYNDIVFHRVIRNFMIQTGDPALKAGGAKPTVDTAAYHYTVPAEIVCPRYFHHKGALAAAREGDDVNPGRASSASQFYIVTGKRFDASQLGELYSAMYQQAVDSAYSELARPHLKEMYLMRKNRQKEKLEALQDKILREAELKVLDHAPAEFTDAQKRAYASEGGAPHLDGGYTVFGEVVEGINVAEAIEKVRTIKDRPVEEVVIKKVTIIE